MLTGNLELAYNQFVFVAYVTASSFVVPVFDSPRQRECRNPNQDPDALGNEVYCQ
jgi:hypothetical protein